MRWKGWDRVSLKVTDPRTPDHGIEVSAIAPLIVSASRSTDIPAFYGDWFLARLRAGYAAWQSPFGKTPAYVSLAKARVFAFWSKNPEPFLPYLDELERRGLGFFFLFTLNDYERERLEPGVPPLRERIATFRRLSRRVGPGRVIWRFDPLLVSDTISPADLLERIRFIGDRIHPFTRRLVISFIDIAKYARVRRNLAAAGHAGVRECTFGEVTELARGLAGLNGRWGLSISACGERRDLTEHGISRGHCIGYDLVAAEFSCDPAVNELLSVTKRAHLHGSVLKKTPAQYLKDPGQRSACGCIVSKDIGQYSTCPHGCLYCYANASRSRADGNYRKYLSDAGRGIFHESIVPATARGNDPAVSSGEAPRGSRRPLVS